MLRWTYTYSKPDSSGIASDDHGGITMARQTLRVTPDGRMTGRYFNLRGRQGILTLERMQHVSR